MIKVVYIITNELMYGDNIALFKILPHLIEKGINPLIVLPAKGKPIEYIKKTQLPYITYNFKISNTYPSLYHPKSAIRFYVKKFIHIFFRNIKFDKLVEQVAEFHPDIIHTNNSFCLIGYLLSQKLNIPHIWHIREYGRLDANRYYYPSKNSFTKKIERNNSYAITITQQIKEYFNLSDSHAISIYDGVFSIKTHVELHTHKENYFLYVGRIFAPKGIEELIEEFIKYYKQGGKSELWIAGSTTDISYMKKIQHLVQHKDTENKIKFIGYRNDVYALMSKAKAIIVPSRFEAFGFITAEALLNGCPVIGRYTAGTAEQFDNLTNATTHGNEYCLPFTDNNEISGLLHKADNKSYTPISLTEIHQYIISKYSSEKSAEEVYNWYNNISNKSVKNK